MVTSSMQSELAALASLVDPECRIDAARQFIENCEQAIKLARGIRNYAVRELCRQHGPARTHRLTGIPQPTVKSIYYK